MTKKQIDERTLLLKEISERIGLSAIYQWRVRPPPMRLRVVPCVALAEMLISQLSVPQTLTFQAHRQ